MKKEHAVYIEELAFSYGDVKVFRNVSFGIDNEDLLCVVGISGVGKTSLLKTIAGILYEDEGTVYMNGNDMKEVPSHRRKISFVFQEPNLYPHLTVYQNIDIGIKNREKDILKRHKIVTETMRKFEISRYANLKPKYLSTGEQQKVALAKCFASDDELYLLDEPLCNIDPESKTKIIGLIKEIHKEKGTPFIIVSHDAGDIAKLATKILVLDEGTVLQYGTVEEVFGNPKDETVSQLLGRDAYRIGASRKEEQIWKD